jgi:hypothetical protein
LWKLKQPRLPAQRGFGARDVRQMIDLAGRQQGNPLRTRRSFSCCTTQG